MIRDPSRSQCELGTMLRQHLIANKIKRRVHQMQRQSRHGANKRRVHIVKIEAMQLPVAQSRRQMPNFVNGGTMSSRRPCQKSGVNQQKKKKNDTRFFKSLHCGNPFLHSSTRTPITTNAFVDNSKLSPSTCDVGNPSIENPVFRKITPHVPLTPYTKF